MPKLCRGRLAILRRGRCLARHDLAAGMHPRRPVFRSAHGEPAGAPSLVWAGPQLLRLGRIVALFAALVVSLTLATAASANVSFTRAWGWGVADGAIQFETCTSTCQAGRSGGGAGQLAYPEGVAIDPSGHVYIADYANYRIDEFTAVGAFIRAYGWGVVDGASSFETCTSTSTCRAGLAGGGAGQLDYPQGVATDSSGDVYVAEVNGNRIDEFSAVGAFIRGYGWGVVDGMSHFETCTSTCRAGVPGGGAGQLNLPAGVAVDPSGDVYVADFGNSRIDEFSAVGVFIRAYGWGVVDGASSFETCTSSSTCRAGLAGGGAGQFYGPASVATDSSGDVYVADFSNQRIDEFSPVGAFIRAYGWGVVDGASSFETCTSTSTCRAGLAGGGAGQFDLAAIYADGIAIDSSGDVYVADSANQRIDEFSHGGAFIKAYGWGIADGIYEFETCTSTCRAGLGGGGAGAFNYLHGVATDSSGDVYVADSANDRIDDFSADLPTVKSVTPDAGLTAGGNTVVIKGTNFAAGATVQFGSTASPSVTFVSATELKAVASAEASGVVNVTVTSGGATSATSKADLYAYGAPTITSFTPKSGITGSKVTITGTDFVPAAKVKFGTLAAKVSFVSPTQLKATVPNGAVPGAISVITSAGTATSSTNYTPTLSITGFSPGSGPVGTVVTISGVGFTSTSTVKFNGTAASSITFVSASQLKATVPAGATTGPITVTNTAAPVGTVSSAASFAAM
jgi:IPT/TIG domain/NHL repeat